MRRRIGVDGPITSTNYCHPAEDTLASDDVLVHFFNDFLNLPSFPKALLYNKETGLFELASEAPEFACRRATAVINCRKPQLPTHEPTTLTGTTPVNNNYTVWCLDREKGIQWIMEERFPFFLQSDCYIEYSSAQKSSSYSSYSAKLKSDKTQELNNPHIEPCICSTEPSADSEMQYLNESRGLEFDSDQLQLEYLAARVVEEVLSNTLNLVRLQSQENISDCFRKEKVQKGKMGSGAEEKAECDKSPKMKSWTTNQGNVPDICCHCNWFHDIRPGLDAFKNFLRGTPGEKLINMWMDTERLKSIQHRERKNRSHFSGGRSMEKMLHALCVDSRAGSYFTNFCVQSGIQLWENAVYFWTDLQHYHELFNQDGLDPYRVQREAQLLYSTYLYSSARRTIGVDEEIRRNVHERLMPAFEELFDEAEEYTLNILLQPWALLLNQDKESFQKVCAQKEVHRVEGQEYSKLQTVYMETECQQKQVSYRFSSLLHDRDEIGHFMTFLQSKDVSIHLSCWLDLEQYRRTKHRDKAVKLEKSVHVAKNYLNRKYFFGPDSPASTEQQNYILHLAGGLEHLTLGCLSNMVVMQIQDIISSHIETTWLPQFLSTAEFTERQKHKPKHQAADWLLQDLYHRCGTKRKAWKAEGLWMTSSKEILLFRQILLNPVTCMNFQHFVSLKGDFLENDVLFWLEVQRYKDLCHSHSDEATIQHKISTIINCFINSSMPPSLQIDIPPEQAQHILEKRHDLGPYIFREAQISVFSELLKFWPEFQELSSSVQEEQLLPLLQEKRINHRAHVRRQRRKEEEADEKKRVQEEQESEESSFSEDADDDMDDQAKEGRIGKGQLRTQSSVLPSPTPPLSWSYSKYMAALKREEVLLRKKSQLEASLSTASGRAKTCNLK
ncbi:regulator of G-protein signaling 22 [Echeneis naucrates]|uniref:regulator of G-protein signaling 22 n=1 Tax=Echeneis naucrates TaxID=173247 RepID=UPI0011144422|nr:regulator of G-protein signaling 22 [Echeneis naucrates]